MLARLDALGRDEQAERRAHRDDRLDHGGGVGHRQAVDERAVELEPVEREAAQVAERRVAGAEVVEHDPHAEAAQRGQHRAGRVGLLHQRALGQLERERLGRQARLAQRRLDVAGQLAARDLARRHVDRHVQLLRPGQLAAPARELGAGGAQHVAAELGDQPALLGDGDEHGRRDRAALGMHPAGERLDRRAAGRCAGRGSAGTRRRSRPRRARGAGRPRAAAARTRGRASPRRRARPARGRAPWRGTSRRRPRAAARRASARPRLRHGDAGRARHVHVVVAEPERLGPRGGEPARGLERVPGAREVLAEHDELVAAEAGDHVLRARGRPQPRGDLARAARRPCGGRRSR